jgi:S-adenosylmethionine/arginine decarboxylase-like enzyme
LIETTLRHAWRCARHAAASTCHFQPSGVSGVALGETTSPYVANSAAASIFSCGKADRMPASVREAFRAKQVDVDEIARTGCLARSRRSSAVGIGLAALDAIALGPWLDDGREVDSRRLGSDPEASA